MIPSIRKYKSKKRLEKLPKRSSSLNFEKIKSVGFLFYLDDISKLKEVIEIKESNFLKDKITEFICYYEPSKKTPMPTWEGITFIQKKDFNKDYEPVSKELNLFIEHEHDLLLDLTVEYHHRMHAVSVLSNAKFKAGMFNKKRQHIHFNIKLEETTPIILYDELIQYLGKLF